MAVTKNLIIILSVCTVGALVAAIAVNVVAMTNCGFMIGHSSQCYKSDGYTLCCKCCNFSDTKNCPATQCRFQALEGFGTFMIILFWAIFAVMGAITSFMINKYRRQNRGATLLG